MENEKLYLQIIENLRDGVYFADKNRRITLWNKAAEDITGYKKEEILEKPCEASVLGRANRDADVICDFGYALSETLMDGCQREHEFFLKHKNGHSIPISTKIIPIMEGDDLVGAIEVFSKNSTDTCENKLIEKLLELAMKDQLTGIPNRRNVRNYLEQQFIEMRRGDSKFCVIFLDIDDFSNFNNIYGHDLGDEVLIEISNAVMGIIRKSDMFGRWGGEEFAGVFRIKNDCDAALIAEKIRVLISNTKVTYEGKDISITVSLGATVAVEDDTIESIIKRADLLMYQSKKKGKNCVTTD